MATASWGAGPPQSHRDERDILAHALATTRLLSTCRSLPAHFHEAAGAFEDVLALYAPERALRAVPLADGEGGGEAWKP